MIKENTFKRQSFYIFSVLIAVSILVLFMTPAVSAETEDVEIIYIYNNFCGACDSEGEFLDFFNEEVAWDEREGIPVQIKMFNAFNTSASVLDEYYEKYRVPEAERNQPSVFIGSTHLSGVAISKQFREVFLAERDKVAISIFKEDSSIVYFYVPSCSACDEATDFFHTLKESNNIDYEGRNLDSNLIIKKYNVTDSDTQALIRIYFETYNVPVSEQQVPVVFLRDTYLSGVDSIKEGLVEAIKAGQGIGAAELSIEEQDSSDKKGDISTSDAGADIIYFLYSEYCESCREAKSFLDQLWQQRDISLIPYEIQQDLELFDALVKKHGLQGNTVPIIIYKEKIWQGYNPVIAKEIADTLGIDGYEPYFLLGSIDQLPLVLSTVIIGLVDGFNPCSLWALLFIMSMILRFQSRKVVLLLGITYILVVAIIYGLFIFGVFGTVAYILEHIWLRLLFFSMAFLLAYANIYSFFTNRDPLVSISLKNKKRFVQAIRTWLYRKTSIPGLVAAAAIIALLASLMELPCTAGFPVMWNALMAEYAIGSVTYTALLLLYLLMYVLVELIIVLFMVVTLSKLYMNRTVGRSLKLVSGMLMAYLGILLLMGYTYLNHAGLVIGGSIIVLLLSAAMAYMFRRRLQ